MLDVHLILGLDIWFEFWVLSFGRSFESSYFLSFACFSVEKLQFLFYSHSVRSYLLEASVQSVLNRGSRICLFVLESSLIIGDLNFALRREYLLMLLIHYHLCMYIVFCWLSTI